MCWLNNGGGGGEAASIDPEWNEWCLLYYISCILLVVNIGSETQYHYKELDNKEKESIRIIYFFFLINIIHKYS